MADDTKVGVKVTAETQSVEPGIKDVVAQLGKLNDTVNSLGKNAESIGRKIGEAFAAKQIYDLIDKFSALGEKISQTAAITGLASDELQILQTGLKLTGGNADEAEGILNKLEKKIGEAAKGSGEAYASFMKVGLSLEEVRNSSPYEVLEKLAKKFSEMPPSIERNNLALELGGKGFQRMIPLLSEGTEGFDKFKQILDDTGTRMTKFQVDEASRLDDQLDVMKMSTEGLGNAIYNALRPALGDVVKSTTEFIQTLTKAINESHALDKAIIGIATAFTFVKVGMQNMILSMEETFAVALVKATTFAVALKEALSGNDDGAARANADGLALQMSIEKNVQTQMESNAKAAGDRLRKLYDDYEKSWADMEKNKGGSGYNSSSGEGAGAGARTDAAAMEKQRQQQNQIEQQKLRTQVAYNKLGLQAEKEKIDQMSAMGLISDEEKLQRMRELLNQEYLMNVQAIEKEKQLKNLSSLDQQKLNDKALLLKRQHELDMQRINQQSTQAQMRQYQTLFQSISRAAAGSVQGILMGTQTLKGALANAGAAMLSQFINDFVIQRVTAWLAAEAAMLVGTETKNTAIMASEAGAIVASKAANTASNIAQLTADGALTFGGVFAFMSPFMGPAAAGPAAASQAAVMAQMPLVALDVGAWEMPQDMPAMLHKGETVVPANFADGLRKNGNIMGGGGKDGGGSFHLYVSAIDMKSSMSFIKKNAAVIAAEMKNEGRKFNKNIPSWRGAKQ